MGIFDNATSVVIGNKEVQSIVRVSDGAVLYQKAASHSYALTFSSATYQTDSSGDVTVYVTLTDNGVPVSGESISFSDATSVYTGITNNNGVASLNYNCQANKTLTASFGNVSASCSIISNYVHSVVLSEPITYTIIWNTPEEYWVELYIFRCINLGVTVTSISELYNPPLTNEELIEMVYELSDEDLYYVTYADGEITSDNIIGDCIGYAVAVDTFDYEHFFTVNYSTTNGSDITITISDN